MITKRPKRSLDRDDPDAVKARERVSTIIDAIPPEGLVAAIKRAPSLRGMILGYIAEHMFEQHVPLRYPQIVSTDIVEHDDHDRTVNKSDRTISFAGRKYGIQLKSIQTTSIARDRNSGLLQADLQNDASDKRKVKFEDGSSVETTCYLRGEYDILAVPLFPFTGSWEFAYKLNANCEPSRSKGYTDYQRRYLLATTERLSWPLSEEWCTDLMTLLTTENGSPTGDPDVIAEPGGKIRVREAGAVILPDKDQKI